MKSMNAKKIRPDLFRASKTMFAASVGVTLGVALRWLFGSGYRADIVIFSFVSLFMGVIALTGMSFMRKDTLASVARLSFPRVGEMITAFISIPAAVLAGDDIILLEATLLQKAGLNVTTYMNAVNNADFGPLPVYAAACALLPAVTGGFMLFGVLLPAWERRGTMYAVTVVALICAGMSCSILDALPVFITAFGIGCVVVSTGSLYMGIAMIFTYLASRIGVRYVRSGMAVRMSKYADLFSSVGGGAGVWLLLLETLLLVGLFLTLVASSTAFGRGRNKGIRGGREAAPELRYSTVFIISCAVLTFVQCMVFSTMAILGGGI